MRINALLLALALFAATPAGAQDAWRLDRTHSSVGFTVTHMLVSEVTGHFKDFDVTMTTTGDDYASASIEATIKTGSVSTDNENRDNHLRSADFFDAEKFPDATFRSTMWEKTGENTFKVTGDLTIRDSTHSIVLDVTYLGGLTDTRSGTRAGWKAETTIDRFQFGTMWNKALEGGGLVVSKDVKLTIRLAMRKGGEERKGPPPPPDKK